MSDLIREVAELVESASGFVIGDQNLEALGRFVEQRIRQGGFEGVEPYLDSLRRHPDSEEWRHLLSRITVKESSLFRAQVQFQALQDRILDRIADRRSNHSLRLWSAGCARGEEAVTLAIVLAEHSVVGSWDWSVLATDVDESALADARTGSYGRRALKRVPVSLLESYFVPHGDRFKLVPELLDRIEYRRLNLAQPRVDLGEERFDVIFLRNVLIYFRPELQRRVVAMLEGALAEGGALFLGPSESLLHLGTSLRAEDLGGCYCYRRSSHSENGAAEALADDSKPKPVSLGSTRTVARPQAAGDSEATTTSFEARLEFMIEALARGENQRAAAGLGALRQEYPESAAARALEGVATERCGDLEGATHAYRAALYLAPEMDEIRFLLARALERCGRSRSATREYRTFLSGSGPTGGFMTAVLVRLGVPDHRQMSLWCRDHLF
jgi:chemotaxis methyl-accepting protein methylase